MTKAKHCAKFSPTILEQFVEILDERDFKGSILDPFGGTGLIHELATPDRMTTAIELEPEWVGQVAGTTLVGDCRKKMRALGRKGIGFHAIITSPTYGNRFADKDMREQCAGTYMKGLQREASDGSSCHLQWGAAYRNFHDETWSIATQLLDEGDLFILNIQDHYRNKKRQRVAGWHVRDLETHGMRVDDIVAVPTPHQTRGANRERCTELVVVMVKA